MNYLVAVSGGVDSVVLLDILSRQTDRRSNDALRRLQGEERSLGLISRDSAEGLAPPKIIVAHVDHGIRPDSTADARFVQGLAKQYGVPYVSTELDLGSTASEDQARQGRYEFLEQQAAKFQATIATAHHQDDMIGSIAINCLRGTGWRGLAVLGRSDVSRPLLGWDKRRIYDYALQHNLEWVEDETNQSQQYLRNRIRAQVINLPAHTTSQLVDLRARQLQMARDITAELRRLAPQFADSRHAYTMLPPAVAIELLRYQHQLTRPAAERLLLGIKAARSHTQQQIGDGLAVKYRAKTFEIVCKNRNRYGTMQTEKDI